MVKAIWNGGVLADAKRKDVIFVDNRYYFPFDTVDGKYITPSSHTDNCPWKGTESFFHVNVKGKVNRNAAWTYYNPMRGYEYLKGYVVFNNSVQIFF